MRIVQYVQVTQDVSLSRLPFSQWPEQAKTLIFHLYSTGNLKLTNALKAHDRNAVIRVVEQYASGIQHISDSFSRRMQELDTREGFGPQPRSNNERC